MTVALHHPHNPIEAFRRTTATTFRELFGNRWLRYSFTVVPALGPLWLARHAYGWGAASLVPPEVGLQLTFGLSLVLGWLYWLSCCRRSIVVGWSVAWWTTSIALVELQGPMGFADSTRDTANGVAISLAALAALVHNYVLRLRKDFGWRTLTDDDRSNLLLGCLLVFITVFEPASRVVDPLERIEVSALAAALVTALTLNVVGGTRWAVVYLDGQLRHLDDQLPPRPAEITRRLLAPVLATYARTANCVLVGAASVAFLAGIANLDLERVTGDVVTILGLVVIALVPILLHRRTPEDVEISVGRHARPELATETDATLDAADTSNSGKAADSRPASSASIVEEIRSRAARTCACRQARSTSAETRADASD